jgi:mRNA-degrading endonuclease RelE of RelBE toxin-antitoxin system
MSFKIYTTPAFNKQLKRLAKKYASLPKDFATLLTQLEKTPTVGKNLGNNCYKIRLAIKSKGKGKSGGTRIISLVVAANEEVFLIAIYDKSEKDSLTDKELKELVKDLEAND